MVTWLSALVKTYLIFFFVFKSVKEYDKICMGRFNIYDRGDAVLPPRSMRIKVTTLNEECYNRIREKILCGEIAWGERIDVNRIAEEFGVSKFPVIKAIERLSLENLVTVSPNRGTYVSTPGPEDAYEITELRIMLEEAALRTAWSKHSKELLEQLDRVQAEYVFSGIVDSMEEHRRFLAYDRHFHMAIVRATDNRRLIQYYRTLRSQVEFIRTHTFSGTNVQIAIDAHKKILDFLREDKIEEAAIALHEHLMITHNDCLQSIGE